LVYGRDPIKGKGSVGVFLGQSYTTKGWGVLPVSLKGKSG